MGRKKTDTNEAITVGYVFITNAMPFGFVAVFSFQIRFDFALAMR